MNREGFLDARSPHWADINPFKLSVFVSVQDLKNASGINALKSSSIQAYETR
jgi:hypothetical protein